MSDPVTKMVGAVDIDDEPALHARKTGHLQIGNQTRGLSEVCGLQETPCGLEGGYIVPKRFDQVSERFSDEIIIINNRNHGSCQMYITIS